MGRYGYDVDYGIVVAVPPAEEPATLTELKKWARIDHNEEDDLITLVGKAARQFIEEWTGRVMITQTLTLIFDDWRGTSELPITPIQSLVSIKYRDTSGNLITADPSAYRFSAKRSFARLYPAYQGYWPYLQVGGLDRVEITVVAGIGAKADIPPLFMLALESIVAYWEKHRETLVPATHTFNMEKLPLGIQAILWMLHSGVYS